MELKLVLQNGLQQQRKNHAHTDVEFIKNMWISKGKVKKNLVFFARTRLIQDWKAAEPNVL